MRPTPPIPAKPELVARKRQDLEQLQKCAQEGLIALKYLDESGCYCQSPTEYAYSQKGKQKFLRGNKRRGRRINIWGVWEKGAEFDYGLMVGTLKSPRFIKLMEWQAEKAKERWERSGKLTVVVLDNASVHRAKIVKEKWQEWEEKGLMLFFLPPRSPELNQIEGEWLHLKRDELAGRVFEDEYELAMGIIEGIEARGVRGGYRVERFLFN